MFQIFEQKSPPACKPFMVVEMIVTCDGIRSRLASKRYETMAEAEAFIADAKEVMRMQREAMS